MGICCLVKGFRLLRRYPTDEESTLTPDENERMALFRYQAILPLLNGSLTAEEEKRRKDEILAQDWLFPDQSQGKIKARTLRHWLWKYRNHGFPGLFYGNREAKKTKGTCIAIEKSLLEAARNLREEDSRRSVDLILTLLTEQGYDTSRICVRTLQRYFKRLGMKRGRRVKGKGQHERYEQQFTNQLWHGDTAHTFSLADPCDPSKRKKAKLVVFVDDASRSIPHGEFYFDEKLPSVLDALAKGLLARGKPARILLDNAKTFRSTTLELMCAELDIGLNFCRPRRPQGKGKIERLIRTIKESFCNEAENAANIETLEELNAAFRGWLERYENKEHEELDGLTPETRWRRDEHRVVRSLTEARIRQAMMLRATRTIHISTALASVEKYEYQASRSLAGTEVQVRWNPERLDQIEIWMDGRYLETALRKDRKPHVVRNWRTDESTEPEKGKKNAAASDYCAALMAGRMPMQRSKDHIFSFSDFSELLSEKLNRSAFDELELQEIATWFKRLSPLDRHATEEKIIGAVEDKGDEQHVRFYLERLEPKAFRR